ncbi:MAG: hypothetical protein ACOWWO_18455 [Peptococcaceae bacterium]
MSFKAIDLQVMIQRSHDVGKVKQAQLQQGQNQDYNNAVQLKEQFNVQENSVNKMDYMINDTIRDDKKNKQEKSAGNGSSGDDEEETAEQDTLVPKLIGNNLDIMI